MNMNMSVRALAIRTMAVFALAFHAPLHASDDLQTGWAAWFNSAKISERWTLSSDVQWRGGDDWEYLRNIVARAGLSYALDDRRALAGGYAWIPTYTPGAPDLTEHRIWQQFVTQGRFAGYPLTQRLRLEQRFIERRVGDDIYSDRLRYYARLMLPFAGPQSAAFTQGYYAAVQVEVFLHLSGREDLNGKVFDQSRTYAGLGWRASPAFDIEVGYMNQFIKGLSADTHNHAIQFALHTRF